MSENSTGNNARFQTRNIVMQATLNVNWKDEITTIAGPINPNDSRESWLMRAARKAYLTEWHTKALFYGQLTNPKWDVAVKVITAANKARLEGARRDAKQTADLYLKRAADMRAQAASMAHTDEDFYRPAITALVTAARILGNDNTS